MYWGPVTCCFFLPHELGGVRGELESIFLTLIRAFRSTVESILPFISGSFFFHQSPPLKMATAQRQSPKQASLHWFIHGYLGFEVGQWPVLVNHLFHHKLRTIFPTAFWVKIWFASSECVINIQVNIPSWAQAMGLVSIKLAVAFESTNHT